MEDIRRSFMWLAFAWGAALALLIVDAVVARAQSESRSTTVEEIVVTAQKREESLQEAAVSVTALTGDQLDQIGFTNVDDIRTFVPNLNLHTNAGGNTGTTLSIRGAITGDPIVTFEPAVGIYVDGLYVSKSAGSLFDAPDLERVEVLRGPQGTLYGRNTIGGAVNLISRRPQDEPEAMLRVGGGNFDSFSTAATLDSGKYDIGDGNALGRVGMRANLHYRRRDGMFRNVPVNGVGIGDLGSSDFDNLNRWGGRIITEWEPRDYLSFSYTFDFFQANERPTAFQLSGVRGPALLIDDLDAFVRPDRVNEIGNNRVLSRNHAAGDPLVGSEPLKNALITRLHNITASADFEDVPVLGDFTLKSISGWREVDLTEIQDLDGTPLHIADFQLFVDQKQFSEEIQVVGDTADGIVDYTLGVYYFEERGGEDNPQTIFAVPFDQPARQSINRFSNRAVAPYGQVSLTPPILDDRLTLTGGLRYTYEKKKATRTTNLGEFPAEEESFENFSPMGNVAFNFTDEILGYYRFARGFKSGGFNGRSPCSNNPASTDPCPTDEPVPPFDVPFKEEIMTSHEVGFRTQWLEDRLQINATGFFQDIEDKQVSNFLASPAFGAVTFVDNADQEMWGAELEALAVPIPDLNLRFSYALLRPEFTRFVNRQGEDVADDAAFVISPEHTVSGAAAYSLPTDFGVWTISADGYWQDDEDYLLFNNDFIHNGDYFIANGRLQLAGVPLYSGYLDIGLWGRNLFDRKYRTFGIDFGDLVGIAGNTYGKRRTFGVDLTWRWGGEEI